VLAKNKYLLARYSSKTEVRVLGFVFVYLLLHRVKMIFYKHFCFKNKKLFKIMYNFIKKKHFTLIYNILKSNKLEFTYSYKNRVKKEQDIKIQDMTNKKLKVK
jgi:hypothetical protein